MNQDNETGTENKSEVNWDNYLKSYFEKPSSFKSWSGLDVKDIYTPEDSPEKNYKKNIADAGSYPFTRGIHANMFRGRLWTKREIVGLGSPEDTHKRLLYLIDQGGTGLNPIADVTYEMGLDADHPWAVNEVGLTGVNITSIEDMETMTKNIPFDKVSWSLITASTVAPVTMAQYVAVAQDAGYDIATLRGSIQNDPIHFRYCGFKPACPLDMSVKLGADVMEYCSKNMPKWYHTTTNMYDLRDQGLTAPHEVGFGFGIAMCYIDELIRRGLDIDDFAPRYTFYVSCHMDIFEEVAKIRAARRMWARLIKEKYGAKNPSSMQFRFGVHTSGCALVPQQPLNNIVRVAYQALAAVLGGVQSLSCCAYDEPICLPSEKAHLQALRTEQILAYETGVANVADPLGGSYYVESLTDKIEEESLKIMEQVEKLGGMEEAINSEWLDQKIESEALKRQKEIESGEKLVVGVNIFTEKQEKDTPLGVQRIPNESAKQQVEQVRQLKNRRDIKKLNKAIKQLRNDTKEGKNVIPAMIDATRAFGTTGELMGTVREVFGYHYDPMEVIESPFK
jgi:methylmalonyl-CoA mutase N-terminal domain/subunit